MKKTTLLFLSAIALTACEEGPANNPVCTTEYFFDEVTLNIGAQDGFWAEGEWSLQVDEVACDFQLPAEEARLECDMNFEASYLEITFSEDLTSVETIRLFDHTPDAIEIGLSFNQSLVFDEVLTPVYVEVEPNGPDCGVISEAELDLELELAD